MIEKAVAIIFLSAIIGCSIGSQKRIENQLRKNELANEASEKELEKMREILKENKNAKRKAD